MKTGTPLVAPGPVACFRGLSAPGLCPGSPGRWVGAQSPGQRANGGCSAPLKPWVRAHSESLPQQPPEEVHAVELILACT